MLILFFCSVHYCILYAVTPPEFELDCSSTLVGLSGLLRVNCFGTVGIASVECNYDNGAIVEACEQVQLLYNERLLDIL